MIGSKVLIRQFVILAFVFVVTNIDKSTGNLSSIKSERVLYEIGSIYSVIKGQKDRTIYVLDNGVRHEVPDWVTHIS